MSDENKLLVRRAVDEIYARGTVEVADELVHPGFVDNDPSHPDLPTGPNSVKETVRSLQSTFGELRFQIEDELAEGDRVVQRVTMSGRHSGPLLGREATGRQFAVRHVYIWRIADARSSSTGDPGTTSGSCSSSGSCLPPTSATQPTSRP
jgi:predicted ester cyclase